MSRSRIQYRDAYSGLVSMLHNIASKNADQASQCAELTCEDPYVDTMLCCLGGLRSNMPIVYRRYVLVIRPIFDAIVVGIHLAA
jgi:hypothetical protein